MSVEARGIPTEYGLGQDYPNPFKPATIIRYQLPEAAYVSIKPYDMLGREIRTLVEGESPAGYHEVVVDASHLASGIYLYRMSAGKFSATKKLVLTK